MNYSVTAIASPDVQINPVAPLSPPVGKRTVIREFESREEADEYASKLLGPYWRDVRVEAATS